MLCYCTHRPLEQAHAPLCFIFIVFSLFHSNYIVYFPCKLTYFFLILSSLSLSMIVSRIFATIIVFLLSFNIGLASALSNEVFANQDAVWSQGLIVSGCLLIFLVVRYGILKFRRDVVNNVS